MADYDAGEITDRERLAAQRQKEIARFNRDSIVGSSDDPGYGQLEQQLKNYDQADRQNARLRDVQLKQLSRKNETDRFEAQRQLQNATVGLLGSMGNQAMNSSTIGNTMSMLRNRNDSDNTTYWQQLMDNQNTVRNAYDEAANQNQVARNDAIINASKAIRDLEGDLAANLSNINPNLYVSPGTGEGVLYAWGGGPGEQRKADHLAQLSGYIMPANAEQAIRSQRNRVQRNDYFGNMLNRFNRR